MSINYRGRCHHSPVKGTNKASKMTRKEAEHALAKTDAAVEAGMATAHQVRQRRRALVKRIMEGK